VHDIASMEMRRRLVAHLRRRGYVRDRRIMRAFLALPREAFLPEELKRAGLPGVYRDDAIVTRRDPATHAPISSSSQPAIMALMLEMLDVRPEHQVLEIGAGTGYNAAILAQLANPGGVVVTMDIDEAVAIAAAAALRKVAARVQVVVGDGAVGMPGMRDVDRLEVTASSHLVPRAWHEQMALGGRLVMPLRLSSAIDRAHAVTAFVKVPEGFDSVAVTAGGFMPLRTPGPPGQRPVEPGESAAASEQPLRRGPWLDVARDDVARLRLSVRYTDVRPPARWAVRRDDHWIGVDVRPA
jgi:protein-L-isoaspartate(D-aspartate) O-methyltransferase